MILTDSEIAELTNKVRWSAQARELATMKIPYRRRTDGSIVVMKEDLHAPAQKRQASSGLRLPTIR